MTRQNAENSQQAAALMSEVDAQVSELERGARRDGDVDGGDPGVEPAGRARSSRRSTRSRSRPTSWRSTPPSKRRAPARPAWASRSSPTRSATWRSARRRRPRTPPTLIEESIATLAGRQRARSNRWRRRSAPSPTSVTKVKGLVEEVSEASRQQTQGIDQVSQADRADGEGDADHGGDRGGERRGERGAERAGRSARWRSCGGSKRSSAPIATRRQRPTAQERADRASAPDRPTATARPRSRRRRDEPPRRFESGETKLVLSRVPLMPPDTGDGAGTRRRAGECSPPTPSWRGMFVADALDHLGTIEATHPAARGRRPATPSSLNDVFRPFHTIKGNAGALGVDLGPGVRAQGREPARPGRSGTHRDRAAEIDVVLKAVDLLHAHDSASCRRASPGKPAPTSTPRRAQALMAGGRRAGAAEPPRRPTRRRPGETAATVLADAPLARSRARPTSARPSTTGRARSRSTRASSTTSSTWSASWSSRSRSSPEDPALLSARRRAPQPATSRS